MDIGTGETESADARDPFCRWHLPGLISLRHLETRCPPVEAAVRTLEASLSGNHPTLDHQAGLDQRSDTGGGLQMSDVTFHRCHRQGHALSTSIGVGQGLQLDRIAEHCAGPMGLDIAHRRGRQAGVGQRSRINASRAGPLGTVSPAQAPSWLTAEPSRTAMTRSPSARARSARLRITTPQPRRGRSHRHDRRRSCRCRPPIAHRHRPWIGRLPRMR